MNMDRNFSEWLQWFVVVFGIVAIVATLSNYISGCEVNRFETERNGRTSITLYYTGPSLPDTLILRRNNGR